MDIRSLICQTNPSKVCPEWKNRCIFTEKCTQNPPKGLCLLFFLSFLSPTPFSFDTGGGGRIKNGKVFLCVREGTILYCNCPLFLRLRFLPPRGGHISGRAVRRKGTVYKNLEYTFYHELDIFIFIHFRNRFEGCKNILSFFF